MQASQLHYCTENLRYLRDSLRTIYSHCDYDFQRSTGSGNISRRYKFDLYLRTILQIGGYNDTIVDYEKIFGAESVYIVDGQYEITKPNEELKSLLEFFGLDPTLIEFNFNKQKVSCVWIDRFVFA